MQHAAHADANESAAGPRTAPDSRMQTNQESRAIPANGARQDSRKDRGLGARNRLRPRIGSCKAKAGAQTAARRGRSARLGPRRRSPIPTVPGWGRGAGSLHSGQQPQGPPSRRRPALCARRFRCRAISAPTWRAAPNGRREGEHVPPPGGADAGGTTAEPALPQARHVDGPIASSLGSGPRLHRS